MEPSEIPKILFNIEFGTLIFFCLATIGLTQLIVESYIFNIPRDWLKRKLPDYVAKVFDCHQCSGTWSGFILGCLILTNSNWGLFTNIAIILASGCVGAFLGTWSAVYLNYLEAKTIISLEDHE